MGKHPSWHTKNEHAALDSVFSQVPQRLLRWATRCLGEVCVGLDQAQHVVCFDCVFCRGRR